MATARRTWSSSPLIWTTRSSTRPPSSPVRGLIVTLVPDSVAIWRTVTPCWPRIRPHTCDGIAMRTVQLTHDCACTCSCTCSGPPAWGWVCAWAWGRGTPGTGAGVGAAAAGPYGCHGGP